MSVTIITHFKRTFRPWDAWRSVATKKTCWLPPSINTTLEKKTCSAPHSVKTKTKATGKKSCSVSFHL